MKLHPISLYLERFEHTQRGQDKAEQIPMVEEAAPTPQQPSHVEVESPYNKALAEAREEARKQFDAQREIDLKVFSDRMKLERLGWTEAEGERLAVLLRASLESAIGELRFAIESALLPFVKQRALDLLLEDYAQTIRLVAGNDKSPPISIRGPRDLTKIIEAKLKRENIAVQIFESDQIDISASLGATTIVSRLEEWLSNITREGIAE
jgi:hypothetical protein